MGIPSGSLCPHRGPGTQVEWVTLALRILDSGSAGRWKTATQCRPGVRLEQAKREIRKQNRPHQEVKDWAPGFHGAREPWIHYDRHGSILATKQWEPKEWPDTFALWMSHVKVGINRQFLMEPQKLKSKPLSTLTADTSEMWLSECSYFSKDSHIIPWAVPLTTMSTALRTSLGLLVFSVLSNSIIESMIHQRDKILDLFILWCYFSSQKW